MSKQIFTITVRVNQDNSMLNKIANCNTSVKWASGAKVASGYLNGSDYLYMEPGGLLIKGNYSYGIEVDKDEFLRKVIFYYGSKSRD